MRVARKPWLNKNAWTRNRIRSNSCSGLVVIWLFALVWNGISVPILFRQDNLWHQMVEDPLVALVLLFPLVGLGLLTAAIQAR